MLIHRLLAWISLYNDTVGRWVKGEATSLYADGKRNEKNMRAARTSEKDLQESIRQQINEDNLENVKVIIQERNGEVSVVKKDGKKFPKIGFKTDLLYHTRYRPTQHPDIDAPTLIRQRVD